LMGSNFCKHYCKKRILVYL